MEITSGVVIEIVNNLIQATYLVGFLYLFLDKKTSKVYNIVSYCVATLLLFTVSNYYTYHELTFNHSDIVFFIAILVAYSLICLRGKVLLRIIMPIFGYLITAVCNIGVFGLFSILGKRPFLEAFTFSNVYRYLFMIVGHATTLFVYWLVLRISKNRIRLNSFYEIVAFIIVPIVSFAGIISIIVIYEHTDFEPSILWYILIIIFTLFTNTVVFWIIVDKISKNNSIKTDLLLSEQREELYKASVLSSSEQLDRMSKIKHDMKNDLNSIGQLIEEGRVDEAAAFCRDRSESIARIDTPVNTDNPTLNAILNVEINKARAQDIDFVYTVTDSLGFMTASDIVSVIGNLCDNAIEYLGGIEPKMRKMSLNITVKNGYRFISCRNSVSGSVLADNPQMTTTKDDRSLHGKGVAILKDMAEKYHGSLSYREDDGMLEATLIVRDEEAE